MNNKKLNFIKEQIMIFNDDKTKKMIKLDFKNDLINYKDFSDNWFDSLKSYQRNNEFELSIIIDYDNKVIKNNETYLNSIILKRLDYDNKPASIEKAFENINYDSIIKF